VWYIVFGGLQKMKLTTGLLAALLAAFLFPSLSLAANPPICPHVIGWNSTIATWAQGAPWIKVILSGDVAPAKATGAKVFYRPWDADSANHDDGCLPTSLTGSQYADMVWAKISAMTQKPDAVGYRNEFNWDNPTCSKRTCAEFVNYKNRLRELGYTGKIIFGSFGVGWVDSNTWNDPDLTNAATAADGIETHEYFDLSVDCGAPWLCYRHRDLALATHPYLQSKEWYIGEFGSDRVCGASGACGDSQCRGGWREGGKLTEQQYVTQMAAYRAGCANQVVAVFVFQQGDDIGWTNYEVLGTSVATWMQSTWGLPSGRFQGSVKSSNGAALGAVTITVTPGYFQFQRLAGVPNSVLYSIPNIPSGTYNITASAPGFGQVTMTNMSITANTGTTANFVLSPFSTLSAAKGLADTVSTVVTGIVTARFPIGGTQDTIYIENTDRTSGLAIATTTPVSIGDSVQAQGTMSTVNGERVLNATSVVTLTSGNALPQTIGINNRGVGGGQFGQQQAVINSSLPDFYASGLNNIGLLVHAWGNVSYIDPAGAFFYMDDGSCINDGSGWPGMRVACSGLPAPASGAKVDVIGISSTTTVNGKTARLLRPRSIADLSYASSADYLFNPGFESGNLSYWSSYGTVDGVQSGSWYGGITAHSGTYFFGTAANWGTKSGGLYQRVPAAIGAKYQARAWSRVFWSGNSSDSVQSKVGIDPNGGTNPNAASIQWSTIDMQPKSDTSAWLELTTPTVTCSGGFVTIFLDLKQTNSANWHINCFDDAGIYQVK